MTETTFYTFICPDTGHGFILTWVDGRPQVTPDDESTEGAEDVACDWQYKLACYQAMREVTDLHSAFRKLKSLGADSFDEPAPERRRGMR